MFINDKKDERHSRIALRNGAQKTHSTEIRYIGVTFVTASNDYYFVMKQESRWDARVTPPTEVRGGLLKITDRMTAEA